MCGPQVRFCERGGRATCRPYSTTREAGSEDAQDTVHAGSLSSASLSQGGPQGGGQPGCGARRLQRRTVAPSVGLLANPAWNTTHTSSGSNRRERSLDRARSRRDRDVTRRASRRGWPGSWIANLGRRSGSRPR